MLFPYAVGSVIACYLLGLPFLWFIYIASAVYVASILNQK